MTGFCGYLFHILLSKSETQMKIVQYRSLTDQVFTGEWHDGTVYALNHTLSEIMAGATAVRGAAVPQAVLTAPVRPGQILCVGKNYADHAAEMKSSVPEFPLIFAKLPGSIIGPNEPIRWRRSITSQVDWEGELGVVIGKTAKDISEADVDEYIFGYVIANDVTARDLQKRDGQWARAKGMDRFCPLGPYIVTRDEIADAHNLTIGTYVNDEQVQNSSTGLLMRRIPELIAYLSQTFTLLPGDLILTGTPSGVGAGMTPPRFLEQGMRVRVEIDGLGSLENACEVED
jgi:2-keto-4-pentenoate hydratase/2-oxohepta-3-ene-1,7-dioic acid hydratase in catechol pathway